MYMAYELVDVSYVHPGLTQSYTYTYPHNLPNVSRLCVFLSRNFIIRIHVACGKTEV